MFERFSDRAHRVVVLAQEEARILNHGYIGTEHILLGLVDEDHGVAAEVLKSFEIEIVRLRSEIVALVGKGRKSPESPLPFTPRAKKIMELALRESLQLGHNYIGTEHLLLGLIREGEGVGCQVLVKRGMNLPGVRAKIIETLVRLGAEDIEGKPPHRYQPGTTREWKIVYKAKNGREVEILGDTREGVVEGFKNRIGRDKDPNEFEYRILSRTCDPWRPSGVLI